MPHHEFSTPSPTGDIERADLITRLRAIERARYQSVFAALCDPDLYREVKGRPVLNFAALTQRTGRTIPRIKATIEFLDQAEHGYNPTLVDALIQDPACFFSGSTRIKPRQLTEATGYSIETIFALLDVLRNEAK